MHEFTLFHRVRHALPRDQHAPGSADVHTIIHMKLQAAREVRATQEIPHRTSGRHALTG
jgi:hypothetical protein